MRTRPGTWASAGPDPSSLITTGEKPTLHQAARVQFVGLHPLISIDIEPLGMETGDHPVVLGQTDSDDLRSSRRWTTASFPVLFSAAVNHLFYWRISQHLVLLNTNALSE